MVEISLTPYRGDRYSPQFLLDMHEQQRQQNNMLVIDHVNYTVKQRTVT